MATIDRETAVEFVRRINVAMNELAKAVDVPKDKVSKEDFRPFLERFFEADSQLDKEVKLKFR